MKSLNFLFAGLMCMLLTAPAHGQTFREISAIDFSDEYLSLYKIDDGQIIADPLGVLDLLNRNMPAITNRFERYQLYLWYYAPAYDEARDYSGLLAMLKQAQSEGFSFFLRTGDRSWPGWVSEIEKLEGFDAFINENQRLILLEKEQTGPEYFVKLPADYQADQTYPLLVVLHGGVGCHFSSSQLWNADVLNNDFIVAYLQGGEMVGTFQRRFNNENLDDVLAMIGDVTRKYPVDENRIFIGGASAGGYRTILLGLKKELDIAGLLLAFPVVPDQIGEDSWDVLKEKNPAIVLITGENDWGLKKQKKFCVKLDELGIRNRMLIFPETGHAFPDDFQHHLQTSVTFLTTIPGEQLKNND